MTSDRFKKFTGTRFGKSNLQKRVPDSLFSDPDDVYFLETLLEK